jgi:hypothetical protein
MQCQEILLLNLQKQFFHVEMNNHYSTLKPPRAGVIIGLCLHIMYNVHVYYLL